MNAELIEIMKQIYSYLRTFGILGALIMAALASVKAILGDKEAVPTAIRQIGIGIFGLVVAPAFAYYILIIASNFTISAGFMEKLMRLL